MERKTKIIGVTGGIGAGKTTVTEYLRGKGYPVVDADEAAREAVAPGEPVLKALVLAFGADILNPDGTLDRSGLAAKVFGDADRTRRLNAITHGDIARRVAEKLRASSGHSDGVRGAGGLIFLVAPLLLESGLDALCDRVWLVTADADVRVSRAAARDGTDEDAVRARVEHQMDEDEKRGRADAVLENNRAVGALYAQVDRLLFAEK
jgi:dephospho-CoA kinase